MASRSRRVMNDPAFAYGKVLQPAEIVESSVILLQARLAAMDPAKLTLEYLDTEYTRLLNMLVERGLCHVTAYVMAPIPKEIWLRHQLTRIARYREH